MAEKTRYPFAAYPVGPAPTVLFCGCALPSQFPRTTDALARVAREHGAGVAFDCCGQPLVEWGRGCSAERQGARLLRRLSALGCRRLVAACPNCLGRLRGLVEPQGVDCLSVYEALEAWNVRAHVPLAPGAFFPPCPDRPAGCLEGQLRRLIANPEDLRTLRGVPCCGLAARVVRRGPEAVRACGERVLDRVPQGPLYTACASCAGQFARLGASAPVRHVLGAILGVDEKPDTARGLLNRARRRFDRELDPLPGACDPLEGKPC